MSVDSGRLQRIEATVGDMREDVAKLLAMQRSTAAELKTGTRIFNEHERRLKLVEKTTDTHSTHLAWIKGLGATIAAALGGLHIFRNH